MQHVKDAFSLDILKGKRQFGKQSRRQKDNIKMDFEEIGCVLTRQSGVIPEKLTECSVSQNPATPPIDPKGTLPCSQERPTGLNVQAYESNPNTPILP